MKFLLLLVLISQITAIKFNIDYKPDDHKIHKLRFIFNHYDGQPGNVDVLLQFDDRVVSTRSLGDGPHQQLSANTWGHIEATRSWLSGLGVIKHGASLLIGCEGTTAEDTPGDGLIKTLMEETFDSCIRITLGELTGTSCTYQGTPDCCSGVDLGEPSGVKITAVYKNINSSVEKLDNGMTISRLSSHRGELTEWAVNGTRKSICTCKEAGDDCCLFYDLLINSPDVSGATEWLLDLKMMNGSFMMYRDGPVGNHTVHVYDDSQWTPPMSSTPPTVLLAVCKRVLHELTREPPNEPAPIPQNLGLAPSMHRPRLTRLDTVVCMLWWNPSDAVVSVHWERSDGDRLTEVTGDMVINFYKAPLHGSWARTDIPKNTPDDLFRCVVTTQTTRTAFLFNKETEDNRSPILEPDTYVFVSSLITLLIFISVLFVIAYRRFRRGQTWPRSILKKKRVRYERILDGKYTI